MNELEGMEKAWERTPPGSERVKMAVARAFFPEFLSGDPAMSAGETLKSKVVDFLPAVIGGIVGMHISPEVGAAGTLIGGLVGRALNLEAVRRSYRQPKE